MNSAQSKSYKQILKYAGQISGTKKTSYIRKSTYD